nr:hypothetical protein CFP56_70552 [Quercus suber]
MRDIIHLPGDRKQPSHLMISSQARELGKFADSDEGRAVEQGLLAHAEGLLDDVERLFRMEYIFAKLLRQWQSLSSPEISNDSKLQYISEALIIADPSWKEPRNDSIYQSIKTAVDVLDTAPWSREMHVSGRYVWQETLMNVMTPLMFFLCRIRNTLKNVESESDAGMVVLSGIKMRVAIEMEARPVLRNLSSTCFRGGSSAQIRQVGISHSSENNMNRKKGCTAKSKTGGPCSRRSGDTCVRYSITERIAIFESYSKFRSYTPLATRLQFHMEKTGRSRSFNGIKSQWHTMRRAGMTQGDLEAKLLQTEAQPGIPASP